MAHPKIGRSWVSPPSPEEAVPGGPAPDPVLVDDSERGTVYDFRELVEPLGVPPQPPTCVLKHLKSNDLVWRWLSEPSCKRLGMRMYETYSPTPDERKLISSGKDAPPGVRVDAENRVRWLDDCFLGVIPRRYFLQRQAMKRQRVKDLTARSRNPGALVEAATRAGAKVMDFDVRSWQAPESDDREPA